MLLDKFMRRPEVGAENAINAKNSDLDVYKRQGYEKGKPVAQHLNFRVYPGEIVGVVGKNGCGKSTLALSLIHISGKTSGANDNKSLAKSPLAIIKGTNFLAEKPNGR